MPASITRGKTFAADEQVTNTKLHNLVDLGTISGIDQTNLASGSGLVVRSTTAPSDTDALWVDTSATPVVVKAYSGSAWVELPTVGSAAAGDIMYFNGTNWVALTKDAGKYLKSGASAVSWDTPATVPTAGMVINNVMTVDNSVVACTTALPIDTTEPANTEGDPYTALQTKITPASNSNTILVEVNVWAFHSSGSNWGVLLLNGATVVCAGWASSAAGFIGANQVHFIYKLTSPGTSELTFNVRCGAHVGSTLRTNALDTSGNAALGGKIYSYVKITEIKG